MENKMEKRKKGKGFSCLVGNLMVKWAIVNRFTGGSSPSLPAKGMTK